MYEQDVLQNEIKCACDKVRQNHVSLLQDLSDMRVQEYGAVLKHPLKSGSLTNLDTQEYNTVADKAAECFRTLFVDAMTFFVLAESHKIIQLEEQTKE